MRLSDWAYALIVSSVLALLSGCSTDLDRDQARSCRLVAVILAGSDVTLAITGQRPSVLGGDSKQTAFASVSEPGLHVDFRSTDATGQMRDGFVDCVFGTGEQRQLLAAVRTDTGVLPIPTLFALNRFWLSSAEAIARDPLPVARADAVIRLPYTLAYGLQQVVNAIPSCAIYTLLAAAYSLIYGLIGRINLAFGAFAAIGGTAALISILCLPGAAPATIIAIGLAAALVPTACYGIASASLVFRPLHGATGQQGLVATIGLALGLGEFLRITQGAEARWVSPILNTPFALARASAFIVTLTPISAVVSGLAICISAGLLLTMQHSAFGREWRAFRDDPGAAALFGISRDHIFAQTFALATGLAGLAGGITVVVFGDITFAYAQSLGMKALTAAILGGIGSVPGALLGGLCIGLIESAWSALFPIVYRDLVVFSILIATLMWRPKGLLSESDLLPRRG